MTTCTTGISFMSLKLNTNFLDLSLEYKLETESKLKA